MIKKAVTFGRYFYFNIGHLSTVQAILKEFDLLVIGLVNPDRENPEDIQKLREKYIDFYENVDKKVLELPLTFEERKLMIEKALRNAKIENVILTEVRRVEYFPSIFNERFRPDEYQLVFPELNSSFDIRRNEVFEDILKRKIHLVKPELESHSSDAKNKFDNMVYMDDEIMEIYKRYGVIEG